VRALILIHRYLGIVVGLLMVVWCLSGIVMIYSPFPRADDDLRVRSLVPLDWSRINPSVLGGLRASDRFVRFQLEMLAGRAVLRLWPVNEPVRLADAGTGVAIAEVTDGEAIEVATAWLTSMGRQAVHPRAELVSYDQWTVAGATQERPLYRVKMGDVAASEIYVSSRTGIIVQATKRSSRFWGWVGAVPHWLYPTALRQRPQAWSQVVIWTALAGTLLTLFGLVIGAAAVLRGVGIRRWSPYRGVILWHHVSGLVFGVLALTWAMSGLLSMNPWGLLEGSRMAETRSRLTGSSVTGSDVRALLESLKERAPSGIQALNSAPLDGVLFATATRSDGSRLRYDSSATLNPLSADDIRAAVRRVAGANATWVTLSNEDTYHYSLPGERAPLPVIRALSSRGDYYYLDPVSGALVDRAESGDRAYRWWHTALHRLDFAPLLRSTFGRTAVMLPLLLGTAVLCGIGCVLALRRVLGATGDGG